MSIDGLLLIAILSGAVGGVLGLVIGAYMKSLINFKKNEFTCKSKRTYS